MNRTELIKLMVELLEGNLRQRNTNGNLPASPNLPLVGPQAALSSLGLVSFLADVESTLAERYNLDLTLVSERAFSRGRSPFRNVEALADYVLELAGIPSHDRS
jgi:hypothetical protein